jgi:undecaprenyl-phosphate 4-deoxy-4-formamido-L-arabinose transferase
MASIDPEISIVVPVYNEEANLKPLYAEIVAAMEAYGRPFEVVAVDDGSWDGSFEVLKGLHKNDRRLRVIRLARNFGQNPAIYAAFAQVRGRVVVTIDADLQNPPADIPKLIDKLDEGYDVVQGVREKRRDNLFRRTASRLVNSTVSRLTKMTIRDLGSGMKSYRREVVDRLVRCTHHSRYLPAETAWLGVRMGEVAVSHRDRGAGASKYGVFALLRVNFDMIASISAAPVHLIGMIGVIFSIIGFGMGARILFRRLWFGLTYNDYATVAALFFFLAGIQIVCTSIMCEYVSRIYVEVQARPYYVVGEVLE